MPLLSIVVPTRDRPYTAVPCIAQLASMTGDDFEIVVSDCSAESVLAQPLAALGDPRIVYRKVAPCSMTDNYNHAYGMTRGDYICFIGDDDGFLPIGLEVVRRLAAKKAEAIAYPYRAGYYWDDFPDERAGKLFLEGVAYTNIDDIVASAQNDISGRDTMRAVLDGLASPPLPVIYHGVVARIAIDRIVAKHGKLFDTMSPDTFASAALCSVLERYVTVDMPLSLYGKAGISNSARLRDRNDEPHRLQFREEDRSWRELMPPVVTAEAHLANSYLIAFEAMGDASLSDFLTRRHLGDVYALSMLRNPERGGAILSHLLRHAIKADRRILNRRFFLSMAKRVRERIAARLMPRPIGQSQQEAIPVASLAEAVALIEKRLRSRP